MDTCIQHTVWSQVLTVLVYHQHACLSGDSSHLLSVSVHAHWSLKYRPQDNAFLLQDGKLQCRALTLKSVFHPVWHLCVAMHWYLQKDLSLCHCISALFHVLGSPPKQELLAWECSHLPFKATQIAQPVKLWYSHKPAIYLIYFEGRCKRRGTICLNTLVSFMWHEGVHSKADKSCTWPANGSPIPCLYNSLAYVQSLAELSWQKAFSEWSS